MIKVKENKNWNLKKEIWFFNAKTYISDFEHHQVARKIYTLGWWRNTRTFLTGGFTFYSQHHLLFLWCFASLWKIKYKCHGGHLSLLPALLCCSPFLLVSSLRPLIRWASPSTINIFNLAVYIYSREYISKSYLHQCFQNFNVFVPSCRHQG